jgi:hypothetical protein
VTFLDGEESPATNTGYTCTDRCRVWMYLRDEAVNYPAPFTYNFCSSTFDADIQDCTGCLSDYFTTNQIQTDLLDRLVAYQNFVKDQANCSAPSTDPASTPVSSPDSATQTDALTAVTDAPSDSPAISAPINTDTASILPETSDLPSVTDTPPTPSSTPTSNTDATCDSTHQPRA